MDENNTINVTIQERRTNSMAVAGLIVSLISNLLPIVGMTGLVGVVLSAIGLAKSFKLNGKGKALAIIGIVIGIIGFVYGIYVFIITLSSLEGSLNEVVNKSLE